MDTHHVLCLNFQNLSHFLKIKTVNVLWLFIKVLWIGLQCVIMVFSDHTPLLFVSEIMQQIFSLFLVNSIIFYFSSIDVGYRLGVKG